MVADGEIDWALGEALAFGSLLLEGTNVRVTGQDTRRGTFSQRHAVLVDHVTGAEFVPLAHVGSGRFTILDSLLSEYACLGFEYGYSVEAIDDLVAWEAQFGDFWNGAEIIVDNFLVAAEDKWGAAIRARPAAAPRVRGTGPRALLGPRRAVPDPVCAGQPTDRRADDRGPVLPPAARTGAGDRTPAAHRVHPEVAAPVAPGALTDRRVRLRLLRRRCSTIPRRAERWTREGVSRVVLCTGKIAYEAMARRDQLGDAGAAGRGGAGGAALPLARRRHRRRPRPATRTRSEVVWLQEEPENMGAWNFVHGRLHRLLRDSHTLRHVSRAESASPATGSAALHRLEQEDLLARAIG